jgi:thiamine-phosphate pyrophosphorylase
LKKLTDIGYYFITDSALSRKGIFRDVESAVRGGCKIVQYREKLKSVQQMIEEAAEIKRICEKKAILLINDHMDVALAVDADGVHLGQDDMNISTARYLFGKKKIIGVTVHNVDEAVEAEKAGADYLGVSPIFATGTKKDAGIPCGLPMLVAVRSAVKIPIVAVGGINRRNAPVVIKAGADSVASILDVVCSDDVEESVREFNRIISEGRKNVINAR